MCGTKTTGPDAGISTSQSFQLRGNPEKSAEHRLERAASKIIPAWQNLDKATKYFVWLSAVESGP